MKKVIIAGATGLVGSSLLHLLLVNDNFDEIVALLRKPLTFTHPKLIQLVINFDDLEKHKIQIKGDVLYFCLGTTKKKTPSEQEYRKIEHDYSIRLAKIARDNSIPQYHYISALGANKSSKIFYNKLKGEIEEDLKETCVKSLHIYQPSLLIGERKEPRSLERLLMGIMLAINPLLLGKLKKYQSIKATTVAKAMLNQSLKELEGIHFYPSDKIKDLV